MIIAQQYSAKQVNDIENMLLVAEIKSKMQESIKKYSQDEPNEKILEKWRYAELLMESQLKESIYDKLKD